MRFRLLTVTAGALLALGAATVPAEAAPAAQTAPATQQAPVTQAVGTAMTADAAAPGSGMLRDPGPECTGQGGGCWEYYSWYWTYSGCHDEGRQQLQNNPGRYDNYNCAGGHGLVVWLWLHRP